MNSHADTIRKRVNAAEADGWYGYDAEARADVRWLLAEIQQLRKVLEIAAPYIDCRTNRGAAAAQLVDSGLFTCHRVTVRLPAWLKLSGRRSWA